MTTRLAFVLVFTLWALGGCVHQRMAPFIESEYAPYEGEGSSTICGQAILKTIGGALIPGRPSEVRLTPKTTYSTEWYRKGLVNEEKLSDVDQRTLKYTRMTKPDSDGQFCFNNIPAGSYYLTSEIQWEWGSEQVYGHTDVKNGQTVQIRLTRYLYRES